MTKNNPALRKSVSNADLYAEPSPAPRHASLSRAFTTTTAAHRPRNPFVHAQAYPAQRLARLQADPREQPIDGSARRPALQENHRHSIAAPYSSNLIDLNDEYGSPQEQQSPPPVPPKIPEIPAFEQQEKVREKEGPEKYTKPFTDFMTANPTIFHAVDAVAKDLEKAGYKKLSERDDWGLKQGGKYYVDRNGSSIIAFSIGDDYKAGNGAAIVAGHIDALTAKLKPVSNLRTKAGYVQLGVAPYAGGLNETWWDRDLGIGGRVLVKENGKIVTKLVKLDWPIARVPTLAPHFGAPSQGPFNKETQMVPIVGIDNSDLGSPAQTSEDGSFKSTILSERTFAATQPERLVKAISEELGVRDCKTPEASSHELANANQIPQSSTGSLSSSTSSPRRLVASAKNSSSQAASTTSSAPGPLSKPSSTRPPPRHRRLSSSPSSMTKKSARSSAKVPAATSSPPSSSASSTPSPPHPSTPSSPAPTQTPSSSPRTSFTQSTPTSSTPTSRTTHRVSTSGPPCLLILTLT